MRGQNAGKPADNFQGLANMNKIQALLMGFAATVGAGGIAAYNGVFSNPTPPAQLASTPVPASEAPKAEPAAPVAETAKAEPAPAAATEVAKADPNAAAPAETPAAPAAEPAAAASEISAPTFDVLRVEPDGSVLIAGNAGADAQVEVMSGAEVLGVSKAGTNGDFAITLANPLKPGDYQLVLRATAADGKAATSVETATVSVPETIKGEVLALVEEPGKPSRLITVPEKPVETAQAATADTTPAAPEAPAAETKPAAADVPADAAPADGAAAEVKVEGEVKAPSAAAPAEAVVIEAVETEGGKIFIAGSAKGVATVRIFANDQALGDAKPGEGDRFLGEFQKNLPAGDYIIRAEGLAADGATVISTASVPFQRQADPAAPATAEANAPAANGTEQAAAPAAEEPAKPKAVIIRRGDTLWQISRRVYGRGVRYSTIYLANKDVTENPNRIFPGQVFKVPEKTPEGEAADPAEIEKRAAPAETPAQ